MVGLPWDFFLIGIAILTPETLWWFFVSRPKNKAIKKKQELNGLFWSIRDKEMDLYGKWLK